MSTTEFFARVVRTPDLLGTAAAITAEGYRPFSDPPKDLPDVILDLLNGSQKARDYLQLAAFNGETMVAAVRLVMPPELEVWEHFIQPPEMATNGSIAEIARLTVADKRHTLEILPVLWESVVNEASTAGIKKLVAIMPPCIRRVVAYAGIGTEELSEIKTNNLPSSVKIRRQYPGYWKDEPQNPRVWRFTDYP